MDMQPISGISNIFKENKLKMDLNEKIMNISSEEKLLPNVQTSDMVIPGMATEKCLPVPNIPNIENPETLISSLVNSEKMKIMNSEFVDEESNNGPLDFSLHRVQDLVFNGRSDVCIAKKSNAPRIKLTLRETSEQRERRLLKGRERMRNLRANETPDEREVRLLKARKCQERRRQRERMLESAIEREKRLAKARERTRLRREQETAEQREKRLRTTRERLRFKRLTETPEERQRRLFLQRERKKEKYHKMTPEEKELMRFSERHSKMYKNDPKPERRQTRGICIKYDTFEDDLDEALLKFQHDDDIGSCQDTESSSLGLHNSDLQQDSEDGSWLAEPEVCLSVGSLENFPADKTKEKEEPSGQPAFESDEATIPPPRDLQEQLSQHISNVVMGISDESKPVVEEMPSYKLEPPCYPPVAETPSRQNFNSYQCNNNQSEYMKGNSNNSTCVMNSTPDYNVYHDNNRGDNRYQFCSQNYPSQSLSNQDAVSAPISSEGYSQGSHPIYTQPSQSMQPNYSDRETPLNLHHHSQMISRFDHR